MRPRHALALAVLAAVAPAALAQKPTTRAAVHVRSRPVVAPMPAAAPADALAPVSPLDLSLQTLARTAGPGKASAVAARAARLGVAMAPGGEVRVLLEEAPGTGGVGALAALGVVEEERIGRTVVARIPAEALADVARSGAVRRVEAMRRRRPMLAAARAETGVDAVFAGTGAGLARAYTGSGAVVGVVDSGLDLGHLDFSTPTGTRLLAARADYETAPRRTFTRAQIDGAPTVARAAMADSAGHGTHVTGIAAGGGRQKAANRGVAPGADIVSVRTNFFDDSITGGCAYVFQIARAASKPAVCNLSLGGHYGPHDGTSLFERTLSGLVAPGYLIVAAAGNEGEALLHAGGALRANTAATAFFVTDFFSSEALFNGWFAPNAVRTVKVVAYSTDANDNLVKEAETAPFTVGGAAADAVPLRKGTTSYGLVSFESETRNADNGAGQFTLYLEDDLDGDFEGYIGDWYYDIVVSGTAAGRVDIWDATASGFFYDTSLGGAPGTELLGTPDYSVAMPATARNVIAAGSYVTTNSYVDMNGATQALTDANGAAIAIGSLATYSSRGPSRDGRMLPTVSAPGEVVASALSAIALTTGAVIASEVAQGGGYAYFGGTSMASPMVAGIVALMLDANPTLTFDQASRILAETARRDATTGPAASNAWGAGRIDAVAAVRDAARLVTSAGDEVRTRALVLDPIAPSPLRGSTAVRFALDGAAPADLFVYDALGRVVLRLASAVAVPGIHEATLDASALAPGLYVVALRAGGAVQTRPLVVVR